MTNVIQWPLPAPDTIIERPDLKLKWGVYGFTLPTSKFYVVFVADGQGRLIVRFYTRLEFQARRATILADAYDLLCEQLAPDPNKPKLVAPVARYEITAAGRAALSEK